MGPFRGHRWSEAHLTESDRWNRGAPPPFVKGEFLTEGLAVRSAGGRPALRDGRDGYHAVASDTALTAPMVGDVAAHPKTGQV